MYWQLDTDPDTTVDNCIAHDLLDNNGRIVAFIVGTANPLEYTHYSIVSPSRPNALFPAAFTEQQAKNWVEIKYLEIMLCGG